MNWFQLNAHLLLAIDVNFQKSWLSWKSYLLLAINKYSQKIQVEYSPLIGNQKIFSKKWDSNSEFKLNVHLLLAIPPARKSSSESSRSAGGEKLDQKAKLKFQTLPGVLKSNILQSGLKAWISKKALFVNDVNVGKFEEAIFCEFWRFPGATEKIKMVNFESLPGVTSPGWAGLSPCSSRHSLCLAIISNRVKKPLKNLVKNLRRMDFATWLTDVSKKSPCYLSRMDFAVKGRPGRSILSSQGNHWRNMHSTQWGIWVVNQCFFVVVSLK